MISDRMNEIASWLPAHWKQVPGRDNSTLIFQNPWLEQVVITDAKVIYWEDIRASLAVKMASTADLTKNAFSAMIGHPQ